MNELNTPFKRAVHMIIHSIINGEDEHVLDGMYIRWGKVEKDLWDLESLASQPNDPADGKNERCTCPEGDGCEFMVGEKCMAD